jgi:cellulose biosynthesis protein BcsQ
MKTVTFFNHKGGVGKTTIVFNTALASTTLGKRVLIVDADAQANLTALALEEEEYGVALERNRTIWSMLQPLVTGAGDFKQIDPIRVRPGVWLLPGDIRLSNFEAICPAGWTEALAGQARGFRVSSALYRIFQALGSAIEADLVLVDLGPNVNALNRTALIAADGFVVPLAPDLFSLQALPSVGNSISTWITEWAVAIKMKPGDFAIDLPSAKPLPLGYVSQQFSVYRSSPSAAFQRWMDRIPKAYVEGILDSLDYAADNPVLRETPALGSLPNFYSLIPIAQAANKAVFELSGSEVRGAQYTKARETAYTFSIIAKGIVDRLEA